MSSPKELPPELDALRTGFERQKSAARSLYAGLSDRQLGWQPARGGWSVAQCLDHLNESAALYVPELDTAIEAAAAVSTHGPRPYRASLLGRLLVYAIAPPYRMRTKTFGRIEPAASRDPRTVLSDFLNWQDEFVRLVEKANARNLAATRLASALSPRLVLNLYDWLRFLEAHERRHLWQARRLSLDPDWPA